MKKIFAAVLAVAVLLVSWYIYTGGAMSFAAARRKVVKEAREAAIQSTAPEDVAALAMKAINMTQGEHGAELWRLKAEWGNVRRRDNILELEKPNFTYYMAPDNIPLTVTSEKGEIDQETQRVRFIGSVVATFQDRVVRAPVMVYSGKERELVCPDGAVISGANNMTGAADTVVWDFTANVLTGSGDVDMTFDYSAAPTGSDAMRNMSGSGGTQG